VGIGFGAIQAGLFLDEAFRSGRFTRLVVAEVVPATVAALRAARGAYRVNIATADGIIPHSVTDVEIYNPREPAEREALVAAMAEAEELATALPSVDSYGGDRPSDVVALLVDALARKPRLPAAPRSVLYAAENHNHAAERLEAALAARLPEAVWRPRFAALNTVIGKMSGVVDDPAQIAAQGLAPITPGAPRAFLVEAFNRILVSRPPWPDFRRALTVFEEQDNLLPFEEAKLYGHNATHALLGYLLAETGGVLIDEARQHPELPALARAAFLEESGAALCRKYAGVAPLFTPEGFAAHVDDLLARMLNPHLSDRVSRVTRDSERKLGWDDRLIGAMRLALAHGITPWRYAAGAAAALRLLARGRGLNPEALLADEALATLWPGVAAAARAPLVALLRQALAAPARAGFR
jgi:mannitol-1-phosphate 5-dehydrogenase